MTESIPSAVVAGHLCLDVVPVIEGLTPEEFRADFVPGRLIDAGPAALSTGGAVSNTGLALHRLGVPTQLMGKIGDDLFGAAVRDVVARNGPGLATGLIVEPGEATSYTIVISSPGLDRFFLHFPGGNDTFAASDIRYDVVDRAGLFHFGYPPLMKRIRAEGGVELLSLLRQVRGTGASVSLDLSFPGAAAQREPWREILKSAMPYTDIFLPSAEEILFMLRRAEYDRLRAVAPGGDILPLLEPLLLRSVAEELISLGAGIVGIKLGYRGFYLRTGSEARLRAFGRAKPGDTEEWAEQEWWSPCFNVAVAGTAGAGDCTIAGFLASFLRRQGPARAVGAATAVGACNVEAVDTLGGVRSWPATMTRIASGWARHPWDVEEPGWRQDEETGAWAGPKGRAG